MTSVEEFNCILCKESFDNKDELQTHFRKHGDPKFNESIKKNRAQNETTLPPTNEKSNDASELVNCDVCEEMFPTISKAITHKHKVHPEHDAKYFCPWCGKLFTMKVSTCIINIYKPIMMLLMKHQMTMINTFIAIAVVQDTDLPIIGHSKKQRLWNQDLLPIYYCSFCGEEYINKVNLHKHICDDHGDENQRPTDVLRCPLCEAIFYHLDAYELHLTFHSSTDLYSESNEMNENELSEYSLETVPPAMERVEDLNNLPNVETDVNAIGIESFLQMAMDEPQDSNQRSKKVKSKKHKKHKKSKKSAITLDEFLNMNQDVFGEGLDFQGVEEVPTKVIKRQLIPRKSQTKKSGAKFVSSADLQKLQKAGTVVKMKSGSKPPPLKIRPIGQPVKENTNNDEPTVNEPVIEDIKNQPSSEDLVKPDSVEMDNDVENVKNSDEKTDLTNTRPNVLVDKNNEGNLNDCAANQKRYNCTDTESDRTKNLQEFNENNDQSNNEMTKSNAKVLGGNSAVTSSNDFKDALKNISRQITIKSLNSPTTKAHVQSDLDKPVSQKGEQFSEFVTEISCNRDLKNDQIHINPISKTLDPLKNINSAITVKSQKNGNISIDNRNSTVQEKTELNITQKRLNAPDKAPVQNNQSKNENTNVPGIHKVQNDKMKETTSSHVLKNLSKNITVTSKSPSLHQLKDENTNKEQDDCVFDDYNENPTENKDVQKLAGTNLGIQAKSTSSNVLKNLGKNITIKTMTPSVKQLNEENESKEQDDSEFDEYDQNAMENKNGASCGFQQSSSSNVLKILGKNITVKSTSPSIKQLEDNTNNEQYDSDFNEYDENPIEKRISKNL
ncbi:hypothetical protein MSG28_010344 [Choristoneura fumiferana]|uniref:Uncharacterized protein n=1 Tax=Choristoneura fumiferana TaxID=7141 RepID=A0ACC0KKX9_CHOFU|nr:hypothetical protein MSG28_010344 [Choristoneura fumiferana]